MKVRILMPRYLLMGAVVALAVGIGAWRAGFFRSKPPPNSAVPTTDEEWFALLRVHAISGGPGKDGIPAIDHPTYESAAEADRWLRSNDIVFGVVGKENTRAYPQRILVWHEIVNDTLGGEAVSVTYCPLTGTAIGFKARTGRSANLTLGVSGNLVNSNLIMYDRATDSRWPQILGQAIDGPAQSERLEEFPVIWTTWERWKQEHPQTLVLSRDTGFVRDYGENGDPYGSYLANRGYYTSKSMLFAPIYRDERLHPKAVVVGIRDHNRNAVAILKDVLRKKKTIEVALGARTAVVTYDETLDFYAVRDKASGDTLNAFDAFWFAWYAFYPQTQLIQ